MRGGDSGNSRICTPNDDSAAATALLTAAATATIPPSARTYGAERVAVASSMNWPRGLGESVADGSR